MKKYFYIALTAFIGVGAASLTACSGGEKTPAEITSLQLEASKTTAEADGQDVVNFTVKDQTGRDVTTTTGLRIMCTLDNSFLKGSQTTMYMDEELPFKARLNGILSNEVTIKGVNHKKYEKYYRHVALYQLTGTWCVNCPTMSKALDKVENDLMPGRTVRMAFHGGSASEPLQIPETAKLSSIFKLNGFPALVVDMRKGNLNIGANAIVTEIRNSLRDYMATCGVKISTKLNGRTLSVTPEVAFEKDGEYSVGWAVLADSLKFPQEGADANYLHNNTVRAISDLYGGLINEQKAGTTWTADAPWTTELPKEIDVKDMRVAVFVLRKEEGDKWYINNIATCEADNGAVGYKLND